MQSSHETPVTESEAIQPPFLYEIRVKGRLASERWTAWFDDLTITTTGGESTLRGSVPDHAALYGLLARLRDLAVPLVMVRVLDADAQRRLNLQSRRYDRMINLLLVGVYLVLLGGLTTITILVAPMMNVALALALLFAALGGLAHAFWLWSGQQAWRWLGYVTWPASAIAFVVYIPLSGLLPTTLGIAVVLFLAAGALIYLILFLRGRMEQIRLSLTRMAAADDDEAVTGDAVTDLAVMDGAIMDGGAITDGAVTYHADETANIVTTTEESDGPVS